MTAYALRGAAVLAAVALAAGCGGSEPATSGDKEIVIPKPSETPAPAESSTAPRTGPVYKLSGSLCAKADQRAITEIYPKQDGPPMVDTEKLCVITWQTASQSLTLTLDADLRPDEQWARDFVAESRQRSKYPVTDVAGVGAAAFWQEILAGEVRLTSYHGNLVLRVEASVNEKDGFPKDIQARVQRVAAGTYPKLAP